MSQVLSFNIWVKAGKRYNSCSYFRTIWCGIVVFLKLDVSMATLFYVPYLMLRLRRWLNPDSNTSQSSCEVALFLNCENYKTLTIDCKHLIFWLPTLPWSFLQSTEGYSGSDIRLLCKEAAMRKVRKIFDLLESHQAGRKPDVSCLNKGQLQYSKRKPLQP